MAQVYKYTPQQIAEMTREQQYILLSDSSDGKMKFKDYAEYEKWKAKNLI